MTTSQQKESLENQIDSLKFTVKTGKISEKAQTSKPARRVRHISRTSLPTLAAFSTLPMSDRVKVFSRWVTRQPKERSYDSENFKNCALAQFGRALAPAAKMVVATHTYIDVKLPSGDWLDKITVLYSPWQVRAFKESETFGELADKLN